MNSSIKIINNMRTLLLTITLASFIILLISSCNEDWLKEDPPHLITTETLYTSAEGFETGLNGLYSLVRQEREGRNGSNALRAEVFMNGTDALTSNHNSNFGRVVEDWATRNNPFDGDIVGMFSWLYEVINSTNTIINQGTTKENIDWTEDEKVQILSEARALRAWAYRHLTYGWGDVPLNLAESKGSNIRTDWVRTPVAEVRKQMVSDWKFAEKHIPVEPVIPGKLSKGAVQHYLSELYLTMEMPDSALYWADQCISTPEYELVTERYGVKADEPGVPFMDMFYEGNSNREEGNTEALWVWQWEFETTGGGGSNMRRVHLSRYWDINLDGVRPIQITQDRGGRGIGRISATKWALDLYEANDDRGSYHSIRKFFVLKTSEENAPIGADKLPDGYEYGDTLWLSWDEDISSSNRDRRDWPYVRKFESTPESNVANSTQFNDQVYIRLAETYLLKAEAQMKLGDNAGAAETINIIRNRSHASEISASDINLDFILAERSRELLFEEHRRHTLVRTGTWLERVRMYNHNGGETASERDKLYAIPQRVIDANLTGVMEQNPGYE